MWPAGYWLDAYWTADYWVKVGGEPPPTAEDTHDGWGPENEYYEQQERNRADQRRKREDSRADIRETVKRAKDTLEGRPEAVEAARALRPFVRPSKAAEQTEDAIPAVQAIDIRALQADLEAVETIRRLLADVGRIRALQRERAQDEEDAVLALILDA